MNYLQDEEQIFKQIESFCIKDLSSHKLIYSKVKFLYFSLHIFAYTSLILITIGILGYFNGSYIHEQLILFSVLTAIMAGFIMIYIKRIFSIERSNIQYLRYILLKEYLTQLGLNKNEILLIGHKFKDLAEKHRKDRLRISTILSILLLPLWNQFVAQYFPINSNSVNLITSRAATFLLILVLILFTTLIILAVENVILKFINQRKEIYLNVSNLISKLIATEEFEDDSQMNQIRNRINRRGGRMIRHVRRI